ncbi:MAG: hypothetical protein COB29_16195 [Sulfitobacter sp.]|nr:MAG: hypothetical protein COB29_16195 [Sulfitobacter sp.]
MGKKNKKPDFIAYSVTDNSEDESYRDRIGAAWFHADSDGINIKLSAIPLSGNITLRKPKQNEKE